MLDLIDPSKNAAASAFVAYLEHAAGSLPRTQRAAIDSRYAHIYGDLQGQRALKLEQKSKKTNHFVDASRPHYNAIIAFEAYFAIICNLVSAFAITRSTSNTSPFNKLSAHRKHKLLADVVSGEYHAEHGISHFSDLFDINFLSDRLPKSLGESVDNLFSFVDNFWADPILSGSLDAMQMVHDRVFPKNLCHITGQFYTPTWLCSLLLKDVEIKKDSTIIDPFCGSGAFLTASIQALVNRGVNVEQANRQVMGIDLSPSACLATRTNIILNSIRQGLKDPSKIVLNVMCADALAPAVTEGNRLSQGMFANFETQVHIDGEVIKLDPSNNIETALTSSLLGEYGIDTAIWMHAADKNRPTSPKTKKLSRDSRSRKIAEQMAIFSLSKASIVATNPPWVGWEYMSRPYREYLKPAWNVYGLFEQKGLEAAFLKEDLSTLCVAVAADRFLKADGEAAILLRPATMQSELAARGLRRLSVFPDRDPLNLTLIRDFDEMKVFGSASAYAAAWILKKNSPTAFPVPVEKWSRTTRRWQPTQVMSLDAVRSNVEITRPVCSPADPSKRAGRWSISTTDVSHHKDQLVGANSLQPRIGFFTGGANAVYYMRSVKVTGPTVLCNNVTERAKRSLPQIQVELESDILFQVIRGRDIGFWNSKPEVFVLCPHTRETKIYPIEEKLLRKKYPKAAEYLERNREFLEHRKGFAGWEKKIHKQFYYTLQRLGDYSFAPFKVCWKYIAGDFVISVVGPSKSGVAMLPNDKVVFVPFDIEDAAYFCAGILSSSPIRYSVVSSMSARQISANIIKQYRIPEFMDTDQLHRRIMESCKSGHHCVSEGRFEEATRHHQALDKLVAKLYGLSNLQLDHFVSALKERVRHFPFPMELDTEE